MEPLVGFYILMGLGFDVIGAYLLVSHIITFKSKWTDEMWENRRKYAKEFTDWLAKIEPLVIGENEVEASRTWAKQNKELYKKTLELSKNYHEKLDKYMEKQKQEFSEHRGYSGLACLIGGFSLQGLGVIIQLF